MKINGYEVNTLKNCNKTYTALITHPYLNVCVIGEVDEKNKVLTLSEEDYEMLKSRRGGNYKYRMRKVDL